MTVATMIELPEEFADILASFAQPTKDTPTRVLDATCHKGHVLRRLGALWECRTFGCEPTDAVQTARLGTTRVIREEFLHTRISSRAMSAGIGIVSQGQDAQRDEVHVAFARKLVDAVDGSGLIALVVPPQAFDRALFNLIHAHLESVHAYDLGSVGLAGVRVFVGVRRWVRSDQKLPRNLFKEFDVQPLPAFARAQAPLTSLPRVDREIQFDPRFLRYGVAVKEARTYGVWADPSFAPLLLAPESRVIQPATVLRRGHLAGLVVGGIFENILIERGAHRFLMKGRTVKERIATRHESQTRTLERFRPIASVVDLHTGESRTLISVE